MMTNRIFVAASLFSFALFPFAARADVHVSTWAELKDAVEKGGGSTIYLDKDITADLDSPITSYVAGTVINGQGFKLIGPEQTDTKINANFFNFSTDFSKDFTEEQRLKIQNLNFENGLSSVYGGAIYNYGTIGDIKGNFTGNYAQSETNYARGGAISNQGTNSTIGDISGDFIGNYASEKYVQGGAISNTWGTIGDIMGNFSGNYASGKTSAEGGAIYNSYYSTIGNVTGDFSGNYAKSETNYAYGGAIYNYQGTIGNIEGTFTGNHAQSETGYVNGGAIYNWGKIGDIVGDFSGNYAEAKSKVFGGAIYNNGNGEIGNIDGNFSGNYAHSETSSAVGGAIYNQVIIGDIIGNFMNNYVSGFNGANGGAIYNFDKSTIGNISGDFKGNYAISKISGSGGGAIYNSDGSVIGDIIGDFADNYAQSEETSALGGAIYNNYESTIGNITGNFRGNYVWSSTTFDFDVSGGAIYNSYGTIGDITGDFTGNYASGSFVNGGAIYNSYGTIGDITGDFTGNYASGSFVNGGAVYNTGEIGNITGNFSGNYVWSSASEITSAQAIGGAINNYNNGIIGDITGDFTGNYAKSEKFDASGGAIGNFETMGNIVGNFRGNYASGFNGASGGAIYSRQNIMGNITGNFAENYALGSYAIGGAIYNWGEIGDITGDFTENYALGSNRAQGGAIANNDSIIGNITGNFTGNYVKSETGRAQGGAISTDVWGENDQGIKNILNSSFYNNYAQTGTTDIKNVAGGAISMVGDLLITADSSKSEFSGNKIIYKDADGNDIEKSEAIYLNAVPDMVQSTLTLNSINNGLIKINDGIRSNGIGTIAVTGDESSRVELNGVLTDVPTVTVESSNLYLGQDVHYALDVNGGSVNNAVLADANAVMTVEAGAVANNTTVKADASLTAKAQAKLKNLLAMGGAVLDIDTDSQLTGDIVIDKDAQLVGTYDYSKIFEDDDKDNGSLTLVGGLNPTIMQADSLITETEAKTLTLSGGDYALGEGTQTVKGWEGLHVKDNAVLKLEGDIELADASKNLHLYNGSVLDLAGHSPSDYTITGSLVNDGSITFSHAGDGADDVTTVKGNYIAQSNAEMTIDVDPVANTADKLIVEGDVAGTTKVIVNPLTSDQSTDKILFVEALNDNKDTGAYFNIYRVIGDAHVWNSLYEDNRWYLGTDNIIVDSSNSGYAGVQTKPEVVSEAIAYGGLANVGIEQTRTLFANVRNNISGDKVYNTVCGGSYACGYDNEALKRVWASPVYSTSKVKVPYKYDADITGLDAGFDIQSDVYNRLGVFASYRKGEYDFKGDSDYFVSKTGSEIDIDSYIGGLYYRYDRGMGHVTAMVYGGIEEADIKTDDGVSTKTDGYVYGAAVEVGRGYAITKDTILEPGVAVSYTGLKYDDIHDRYGKSAKYDDVSNLEAELYLRAEKNIKLDNGIGKLYLKPAIVHNMGEGKVAITGLDKVDSLKDMTYGRIEAGGSMELTNGWSLYAMIAQAFGKDYHATSFNIGVSYAF